MSSSSESDSEMSIATEDEMEDEPKLSLTRLPNRPHPAVAKLKPLDFSNVAENFFVIVYGKRRTGKTHAVSCLLEQVKDRFDFAYLFSNTAFLHKNQKGELDFDMIRDEAKFKGFDEEILNRIVARQRAVIMHNNNKENEHDKKPNKTLLIFDDFVHEKAVRYSRAFTELPVLGRHHDLSVICLTQGYSSVASGGLNKATRQNADLVMTFLPRNFTDLERISEWYLCQGKAENMWFTRSVCREKHQLLACDLTEPNETEYVDFCYKYKAPPKVPAYELGKIQWKLWREEQKRQKKAALQAQVENERKFLSADQTDMEKMQRVGQATGLPDNRTPISMYDALHAQMGF